MFKKLFLIAVMAITQVSCYDLYEAEESLAPTAPKNFQDLILDLSGDPDFYWNSADSLGYYAQNVELCIVLSGDTTPVKFYSIENSVEFGLLINGTRYSVDSSVTTTLTLLWDGNEYQMPLSGWPFGATAALVSCTHGGGTVAPVVGDFIHLIFALCGDQNYYWDSLDNRGYYAPCAEFCLINDSGEKIEVRFYATENSSEVGVKANGELNPVTTGGDTLWVTYDGKLYGFPLTGGLFGNSKLVECVHTSTPTTLGFAELTAALCGTPDFVWVDSLILNSGINAADSAGIGLYGTTCSAAGWEFLSNGEAPPVYFFAESGSPTTQWGIMSQWGDRYYVTADPAVKPLKIQWQGKTYVVRVTNPTTTPWYGPVELRKQ